MVCQSKEVGNMKTFILIFLFSNSVFAVDQYRSFSITPVTPSQAQTVMSEWEKLDQSGSTVSSTEYIPSTNTVIINICGPDLTNLRTRIRSKIQNLLSKLPDTDVVLSPGDKCKTGADVKSGN